MVVVPIMESGRIKDPGLLYPDLGSGCKGVGTAGQQGAGLCLPLHFDRRTPQGDKWFPWVAVRSDVLSESMIPPNIARLEAVPEIDHKDREALRDALGRRFANTRRSHSVDSQNSAFQRVNGLMASAELCSITKGTCRSSGPLWADAVWSSMPDRPTSDRSRRSVRQSYQERGGIAMVRILKLIRNFARILIIQCRCCSTILSNVAC